MAAEESSQGAALGPDFSKHAGGARRAKPDIPDLGDVLGEFMEALCVIDVVSRVLTELSADASERVGACAVTLKRGYQLLDGAYRRFDERLSDLGQSDRAHGGARRGKKRGATKPRTAAKKKRLPLGA